MNTPANPGGSLPCRFRRFQAILMVQCACGGIGAMLEAKSTLAHRFAVGMPRLFYHNRQVRISIRCELTQVRQGMSPTPVTELDSLGGAPLPGDERAAPIPYDGEDVVKEFFKLARMNVDQNLRCDEEIRLTFGRCGDRF